jgi:hypothetical protein
MKAKKRQRAIDDDAELKPPEPASVSPSEYNAVVANAELVDVLLVGASFKIDAKYFDSRPNRVLQFGLNTVRVVVDEETGTARGAFSWSVKAVDDSDQLLKATATFIAVYRKLEGQKPEAIEIYIRKLGPFTTYPYFRSHMSELSWLSKANLPILPVLTESSLAEADDTEG